jgi:hypothetical protein
MRRDMMAHAFGTHMVIREDMENFVLSQVCLVLKFLQKSTLLMRCVVITAAASTSWSAFSSIGSAHAAR